MATKKPPPSTPVRNYRDAGDGRYVKQSEAERRPKETVSEPRGGKKGK